MATAPLDCPVTISPIKSSDVVVDALLMFNKVVVGQEAALVVADS